MEQTRGYVVIGQAPREASGDESRLLYKKFLVDPTDTSEPDYLLSYMGAKFLPRGDIQAVKAKPKSGKTLFTCLLAASALGCEDFGVRSLCPAGPVLYADTEQNRRNTAMFLRRAHAMAGEQSKHLISAISLREVSSAATRLDIICSAIADMKPTLAIVDGIADLTTDFNDIEQSQQVVSTLSKLAQEFKVAIVCVLHTNKQQGDSNMKGHLGSILLQKASDAFEVRNSKSGVFTVEHTDTRNAPIRPIRFTLEEAEDGNMAQIKPYNAEAPSKREDAPQEGQSTAEAPLKRIVEASPSGIRYSKLVSEVVQTLHKSESTAKRIVKKALQDGFLTKNEHGMITVGQE